MDYIRKNNVYTMKMIFLFFLMTITSLCFETPISNARYQDGQIDYLKYHSTLALMKKEKEPIELQSASSNLLAFSFSLSKDVVNVKEGENSHYKLLLPAGCSSDYLDNIVSFTDQDPIEVSFTCNLVENNFIDSNQHAEFDVSVIESVENEDYFLYQDYHFSDDITVSSFSTTENVMTTPSPDILLFQDSLIQNLLLYNQSFSLYRKEIESYIKSFDCYQDILGLHIHYRDYYDYDYTVDDSFIGYVKTYYENQNIEEKNVMYFTDRSDTMEEVFSYYLKTYYCASDVHRFYLISNYIASLGGISAIVQNNMNVEGITFLKDENKIILDNKIVISSSDLVKDFKIPLYVSDPVMRKEVFITSVLENSNLSFDLRQTIVSQEDLMNYLLEDFSEMIPTTFVIGDKMNSLVLNISIKDGVCEVFLMPISVEEQMDFVRIRVLYGEESIQDLDPVALMTTITQNFSLELGDHTYQVEQNGFSFIAYSLKEEEKDESDISTVDEAPPSSSVPPSSVLETPIEALKPEEEEKVVP